MPFTEFLPPAEWRTHIAAFWIRQTPPEASPGAKPGITPGANPNGALNTSPSISPIRTPGPNPNGALNTSPKANPLNTPNANPVGRRVYADGCADLICNAGSTTAYYYPQAQPQKAIPLLPGKLYLGGTMTAYGVVTSQPGSILTGIRFWPGGFDALFSQDMQPAVDSLIEFPDEGLNALMPTPENLEAALSQWLAKRPTPVASQFTALRKIMYDSGGRTSVQALAKEIHVTNRTLERIFKKNVGIPPKEFLKIIRFQAALKRLRARSTPENPESLLRIAYELGYYDHAHLTNEFKKYAGIRPGELSFFYKTGIADGQYF